MDHRHLHPIPTSMDSDCKFLRELIRLYDRETDPMKRQLLMQKMEAAKARIDYERMVVECG